jgi:hypothetical protein
MAQRPPNISSPEIIIVMAFAVICDLLKFSIAFFPFVDLVGIVIGFIGLLVVNAYFLFRVGPSFLSGKRSSLKIATMAANGVLDFIPVLGDFIPEVTIYAASMFWLLHKEHQEYAAAKPVLPKKRA